MVGDSWTLDVLGARAAGLRAVWFNRLGSASPAPRAVPEIRAFEPVAEAVATILGRQGP
jgi:FMN phosphatase YigB (HAD superfamily)